MATYLGYGADPIPWTVPLCCHSLGSVLPFVVHRTEVTEGRVPAVGVVERTDVLVDRRPGLGLGGPGPTMDQLGLEGGEEAFRHRVVPAISNPTHTADDPTGIEL